MLHCYKIAFQNKGLLFAIFYTEYYSFLYVHLMIFPKNTFSIGVDLLYSANIRSEKFKESHTISSISR